MQAEENIFLSVCYNIYTEEFETSPTCTPVCPTPTKETEQLPF